MNSAMVICLLTYLVAELGVFGVVSFSCLRLKGDSTSLNARSGVPGVFLRSCSRNAWSFFNGELILGVLFPGESLWIFDGDDVGVVKFSVRCDLRFVGLVWGDGVADLSWSNRLTRKSSKNLLTSLGCTGIFCVDGSGSFNACWYFSVAKYAQKWPLAISARFGSTGFFCKLNRYR